MPLSIHRLIPPMPRIGRTSDALHLFTSMFNVGRSMFDVRAPSSTSHPPLLPRHSALILFLHLFLLTPAHAGFRHVGDFLLTAHFKITGEKVTPIPMKPIAFHVYTDGITVRVAAEGEDDAHTSFEIYRSDGIGRQRDAGGALEVIPGIQATSTTGGVLRHLRLSTESLTITTFPGVSDQTIVSHAIAAEMKPTAATPE